MGLGIVEIVFIPVALVIGVGGTVFWIWMMIDCATKERDPDRLVWIIIVVLTHIIGALIYFFVRRPVRRRTES
jgi:peptidoglycan/LPS O-acetylase OafA/YrhL